MFSREKWKSREEAYMIEREGEMVKERGIYIVERGGGNGKWKEGMYSYEGEGKMEL